MPYGIEPMSPFVLLHNYELRSLSHVAGVPEQIDAPGLFRGIAFRIGERRLVAAFSDIVEILTLPTATHVPGTQPWLLGVANVRGTLMPVVDLKLFLEGERTVQHANTRTLLVRQPGGNVAVLIDELYGQRNFNDSHIADTGTLSDGNYGQYVKQAYRLGDVLWGVFNMSQLTRSPDFRQSAV